MAQLTTIAKLKGDQGDPGPQGLPGPEAVPAATAVAAYISEADPDPDTNPVPAALNAAIVEQAAPSVADALAIARLDRQIGAALRTTNAARASEQTTNPSWVENWTDLTAWTQTGLSVSGGRVYSSSHTNPSGGVRPFQVNTGERVHLSTTIRVVPGDAAGVLYVGFDCEAPGTAQAASEPKGFFIGMNTGLAARSTYRGSTLQSGGVNWATATKTGADPTETADYQISIDIDDYAISASMKKVGDDTDFYASFILRSRLAAGDFTIGNVNLHFLDSRGTAGSSIGPIEVTRTLGRAPMTAAQRELIEVDAGHILTADPATTDGWHIVVPPSYDPTQPAPLVVWLHPSLDSDMQHTAWTQSRSQALASALADAGFIVAAARGLGDSWGSPAGLAAELALYKGMLARYNIGPTFLVAESMGGLVALNLLSQRDFPTPAACALIGGVCDLDIFWNGTMGGTANRFQAGITSGYGLTVGTLSAAASAGATSLPTTATYPAGTLLTVGAAGGTNIETVTTTAASTGTSVAITPLVNPHASGETVADYAQKTQGYNPMKRSGADFRGVPLRFYTSHSDATVWPTTNQEPFAARVEIYAAEATIIYGTGGHLDPSMYQPSDVVSFFDTYR
jgi:pimeloyl-ACP methyl ester carboxylesterase